MPTTATKVTAAPAINGTFETLARRAGRLAARIGSAMKLGSGSSGSNNSGFGGSGCGRGSGGRGVGTGGVARTGAAAGAAAGPGTREPDRMLVLGACGGRGAGGGVEALGRGPSRNVPPCGMRPQGLEREKGLGGSSPAGGGMVISSAPRTRRDGPEVRRGVGRFYDVKGRPEWSAQRKISRDR
jgi:hypothetical protein